MASAIKERSVELVDRILRLRLRRNAMTEASKPKPTDHFHHRYADKEVLRKALIEMGFKDEDIKIWVCHSVVITD